MASRSLRRSAAFALLCAVPLLSGCPILGSAQVAAGHIRGAHEMEPTTGIGPGPADLRRSNCACIRLELDAFGAVVG